MFLVNLLRDKMPGLRSAILIICCPSGNLPVSSNSLTKCLKPSNRKLFSSAILCRSQFSNSLSVFPFDCSGNAIFTACGNDITLYFIWIENELAGVEGFEPPNDGTRTRCLTTWRHPILREILEIKLAFSKFFLETIQFYFLSKIAEFM